MKTKDLASADVPKMHFRWFAVGDDGAQIRVAPPCKTMTPDQVKDMVAYIRSLKK